MPFKPKETRNKVESVYKTLYISQELVNAVDKMAAESKTSFNNIVVSMVEYCLNESGSNDVEQ